MSVSKIYLSTTGTQNPVVLADMGSRTFAHPTVNYDLLTEYSEERIRDSASVAEALAAGYITLLDGSGNNWDCCCSNVAMSFNEPAADITAGSQAIFDYVTVGESVVFGNLLYLKSDGKWWLADADSPTQLPGTRLALEAKSADQKCQALVYGRVRNDAWNWTVGGIIYASTTAGGMTQTAPPGAADQVQIVGVAYHADKMLFQPGFEQTLGEKPLTGFLERSLSTLGMSGSNFQVTTGSSYVIYSNGRKFTKSTTQSVAIASDLTLHYVYFDTSGVLQVSTSAWDITSDNVLVAMVFKDGSTYAIFDERHSAYRDRHLHAMLHKTVGARYDMATGGLTGTFDNTTLSITRGTIFDEDLANDTGSTRTAANLYYRNSGLTSMRVELASSTPYKASDGVLQYDNAGTLAGVSGNSYANYWVYATNDITNPIAIVVGQSQNSNLSTIRSEALPSILISNMEWKLIYRLTYRNVGGTATYVEKSDYRTSSSLPSAGTPAVNAASVTFAPTGNVSATNAQAAIEELDSEKAIAGAVTGAGLTMATARILGRTTANTGAVEEITVGSGLSLSGGLLTATGGGAVTFNEPAADTTAGTQSVFDSATVGESVVFGNLLYQKSDSKWWLADADQSSTMPGLRMALESKSADQTCSMLVAGRVRNDAWNWTVGGLVYASTTSGGLTQTAPSGTTDQVQVVGFAYHADKMLFQPSPVLVEVA